MSGVVITGGASGIGRACAQVLVGDGRAVALWDRSPSVVEAAAELGMFGVALDVTDDSAVAGAVEASAAALGGIDGFVHAAGVVAVDPLGALTPDGWDGVLDVNLRAHALLVQALLPHLREATGAAVVGVASIEGLVGNAMIPSYCASKAGLLGLTRAMAAQLGADGIRVNAVCPGFVETPMLQMALDTPGLRDQFEATSPLGRIAQPIEIAHAVAFLLSDRATFITGEHLTVDGGSTSTQHALS